MDTGADTAVPQEGTPSPGAVLAAERERQGLSRADIAQRLHMSVAQVEALEIGDYERLPRGPFLRGFARNYARALGLDPEAVVGLIVVAAPRENAPRIVVPSQNIRFDPLGHRLASPYVKAAGIAAVAIVLGFAAMYWWLFVRPLGAAPAPAKKPAATAPAAPAASPADLAPGASAVPPSSSLSVPAPSAIPGTLPPAAPSPATPPGPSASPVSVPMAPHPEPAPIRQAARSGAAPAPVPGPAPAPAPPPSAAPAKPAAVPAPTGRLFEAPSATSPAGPGEGAGVIRMSFRVAAWVEVKDASGRVLLSRNQPGGSDAEVAGKPPLAVVIGNASGVRLTFNDREVDLEPHTRVSVARLTLP